MLPEPAEVNKRVRAMALRLFWKHSRKAAPALSEAERRLAGQPEDATQAQDLWGAVVRLLRACVADGGTGPLFQNNLENNSSIPLIVPIDNCSVTTIAPGQPPEPLAESPI